MKLINEIAQLLPLHQETKLIDKILNGDESTANDHYLAYQGAIALQKRFPKAKKIQSKIKKATALLKHSSGG